jgi:threonyl-tRNA synthetase
LRSEKIGYKIREAQVEKTPYMIVVGDKEQAQGSIALRARGKGDLGVVNYLNFKRELLQEISEKNNG